MRGMNPEPDTEGEVSQKEKSKYCILTHIYGIYRKVVPICREGMEMWM